MALAGTWLLASLFMPWYRIDASRLGLTRSLEHGGTFLEETSRSLETRRLRFPGIALRCRAIQRRFT
jgi:hypothetical protein